MYYHKPPFCYPYLFNDAIFSLTKNQHFCITFDDGPHPNCTPFILDQLAKCNQKAIFFNLGKNIERYPKLYENYLSEGHVVANHGYEHLNGWKTANATYYKNVERGAKLSVSKLFRPPYGKISYAQYKYLKKTNKIIFWDLLIPDYDKKKSANHCIHIMNKRLADSSISVLHENDKAYSSLRVILPKFLARLTDAKKKSTIDVEI